jgi:hypothetical protein
VLAKPFDLATLLQAVAQRLPAAALAGGTASGAS